ncbi:MAG: hypothetical protein PHO62_07785 [Sulfurimonas sp.]|uniref:hypothetical protein n=1 Tax=Sulfurimonas sp. TaxID=2022749 RepID=UPI00262B3F21|nr:hypothetical protein [Sulfurimonas sp.]MDD5373307.1 hypothetical protein [Sulfurimonas sp.]
MIRSLFFLLFLLPPLFANYQSIYIPDNLKKDLSEGNVAKYQTETIPVVSLEDLKRKAVLGANATLTRSISGAPTFEAIMNADICRVDTPEAFTSTIYEMDLPSGVITCMYAAKGNLYNPMGLFKMNVPEIKAYYTIDSAAAKTANAGAIGQAEAQFAPLLAKKQEIVSQMNQGVSAGYLTIPELLLAAVLTDDKIIDIPATKSTGKFQLKSGYTSKFTNSSEVVDNSEYLLTDAATIFEVYVGLSRISMDFLLILTVGFGVFGGARFFGGIGAEKLEDKTGKDRKSTFIVGLAAGVLLFFPVNSADGGAAGQVGEYELLKTRYQDFEKFGYYNFAEWGKQAAKVVMNAETDTLIRKSGLATKEQIVSTAAQSTQAEKLQSFYTNNFSTCLNDIYKSDYLFHNDNKTLFGESDKSIFPSTEHWAYVALSAKSLTEGYYEKGAGGVLQDSAAVDGRYPKFAFSSCGKAEYLSTFYRDKKTTLNASFEKLTATQAGGNDTVKMAILGKIFEFQYQLYRDWGILSILGLPVTKMQTEYIGGLYKSGESEVLEKLNKQNGTDTTMHQIMSSIPYMFVPGAGTVFSIVSENSGKIGGALGGAAGGAAAGAASGGLLAWLGAAGGAALGSIAGTVAGAPMALYFAHSVAVAVLALAPIIAIIAIGLLRFIIIILKIFSFHFLSLFMMPIMFLKENVRGIATFSVKILATMLEVPVYVLSIWLAVTANSLIHTIGNVFSKNIVGGMLANNEAGFAGVNGFFSAGGIGNGETLAMLRIYVFDGFMEVAISVFSIVIVYKIIVSLHSSLFELFEMQTSNALDSSIESMKNESSGWGTRI